MDRRRFKPTTECLDDRVLLSSFKQPTNIPAANLQQKTLRIERLPAYFASIQPGRQLPMDTMTALQDDLRLIVGKLDRPPGESLVTANLQYRSVLAHTSLSREDAAGLQSTFTQVITDANMPADAIQRFQTNMTKLVQADTFGRNPAMLAANDYALMLQTILGVGRPIRTPAAPRLAPADDSAPKGDHKTTVTQPHLVGTYDAGTTMQILDENDQVIGQAAVANSGQYSVAPSAPLSVGVHTLRVRAFDANNDFSAPSKAITITIKAPPTPRHGLQTNSGGASTSTTPTGPLGF